MSAAPDRAEELFTEHSRRIYAYCLRQLGSREEAEDAVQATYLNACRSLLSGFEPDVAQAWLYKVAHNVCLTKQRSSWRRRRVERPGDLQEIEELVAAPHDPGDELLGIDDALASLPEQQRRAILLREWKGLSYREIAAEMELSQGAVETLIFRARRSLAAALDEPETRTRRARLVHAFDGGALVASLKAALGGSLSGSLATGLAVAASATAIATGPGGYFDWVNPSAVAPAAHVARAPARPIDRSASADRDPSSVARQNADPVSSKSGKALGRSHEKPAKANGRGSNRHGKPASAGSGGPPPHANAGGNSKSNAGGNGKSNAGGNSKSNAALKRQG
jgi:RNA polymerase sigma-70 factor, ECF subfamily